MEYVSFSLCFFLALEASQRHEIWGVYTGLSCLRGRCQCKLCTYWLTFNQIPQGLSVLSKLTGRVAVVRVADASTEPWYAVTGCVSSFVPCAHHCFNRSSELKLNNSGMVLILHCFEENFTLYMCFLVV